MEFGTTSSKSREDVLQDFYVTLNDDHNIDCTTPDKLSCVPTFSRFAEDMAQSSLLYPLHLTVNLGGLSNYECVKRHYCFLGEILSVTGFRSIINKDAILHSSCIDQTDYTVNIFIEAIYPAEGELTLEFQVSGVGIYILSFTIVGGHLFKLPDWEVILVSRLQGVPGKVAEIRSATKAMNDISPQAILVSALVGISRAMGIHTIVGVSGTSQLNYQNYLDKASIFRKQYDEFFLSTGWEGPFDGFYTYKTRASERSNIPQNSRHPRRANKKRSIKDGISESTSKVWDTVFAAPGYIEKRNIVSSDEEIGIDLLHHNRAKQYRQVVRQLWDRESELEACHKTMSSLRVELAQAKKMMNAALANVVTRAFTRRSRSLWLWRKAVKTRIVRYGLFDKDWYLRTYPDVADAKVDALDHYMRFGAKEARDPNRFFSTAQYLATYPDVAKSGVNPLLHYCLHGAAEGRIGVHKLY